MGVCTGGGMGAVGRTPIGWCGGGGAGKDGGKGGKVGDCGGAMGGCCGCTGGDAAGLDLFPSALIGCLKDGFAGASFGGGIMPGIPGGLSGKRSVFGGVGSFAEMYGLESFAEGPLGSATLTANMIWLKIKF